MSRFSVFNLAVPDICDASNAYVDEVSAVAEGRKNRWFS
jgi:hypothetical protein